MVLFYFEEEMKNLSKNEKYNIMTDEPLKNIRGLALDIDTIINLSSVHWKELQEEQLIDELEKTITHEQIHFELRDIATNISGEEWICRLMSRQLFPTQIETFI